MNAASIDLFELELLGGRIERRYRRARPEVEALPWGTLDRQAYSEPLLRVARRAWTAAAFQEYRTAFACAATLRALIEVRAPLDLQAVASRFPLDEMVHVELCARMAMALGGGSEIRYPPDDLVLDPDPDLPPLLRAADLIVRCFCVGEALSIPLLRGTWRAARHPLARAILGRIVRDEAAHGTFGFTFLDWAAPELSLEDRAHLARAADRAIDGVVDTWESLRLRGSFEEAEANPLGWMQSAAYLRLAERSLAHRVVVPLASRAIPLAPRDPMTHRRLEPCPSA
jgi:hypothetical protein